jgi:hypothetical protein
VDIRIVPAQHWIGGHWTQPVGTSWINDHNRLFTEAEMGGYRRSGLGRLHGQDARLDFTEQKHVYENVGVSCVADGRLALSRFRPSAAPKGILP